MVERADPDRFAACMAAPLSARAKLWPLYAFNLEVARAAYASDEPLIAEMRLQWWQDELARLMQSGAGQGDVAQALSSVLIECPGVGPQLAALIEARRWDCWREPFAGSADFEAYIDATAGSLAWAAALALGAPPVAEAAVRDFAFGAGLANWFDAVPALRQHGRQPLPDPSRSAIAASARLGLERIARARMARLTLPAAARPALWSGWSARRKLKQVVADPGAVDQGLVDSAHLSRSLALARRSLTSYW